jgi:hypothetical protein
MLSRRVQTGGTNADAAIADGLVKLLAHGAEQVCRYFTGQVATRVNQEIAAADGCGLRGEPTAFRDSPDSRCVRWTTHASDDAMVSGHDELRLTG